MDSGKTKILVITGSYPPDICGVGDYTHQLMQTACGRKWNLYHPAKWGILSFRQHVNKIRAAAADVIIMQYPTQGYGWSLVPHFLAVFFSLFTTTKFVINLHEYSQQSTKSKLAINLMFMFVNGVIFTNGYERDIATKTFGRLKKRSKIVKIYSNIGAADLIRKPEERNIDLVYFGHIRPGKGLETYIKIVEELRSENRELNICVMGQIPAGFEQYAANILQECERLNISILLNRSGEKVAECLNDAKIACLPFPDGVSERRGSFLAALKNGAVVVTTRGKFVTAAIDKYILTADSISETVTMTIKTLSNADTLNECQKRGFAFLEEEIARSWDEVSEQIENDL